MVSERQVCRYVHDKRRELGDVGEVFVPLISDAGVEGDVDWRQVIYVHILWFGLWIGLGVEKYPFGLLTMIVSLEAIFLSTFVLISQNRADAKRQVIADREWKRVQIEDHQKRGAAQPLEADSATDQGGAVLRRHRQRDEQHRELLDLSRQTLVLAKQGKSRLPSDTATGSDPRR